MRPRPAAWGSAPLIPGGVAGRVPWRSGKPVAHTQRWVMLVVAALLQAMWVYTSGNLKDWTRVSTFGPAGSSANNIWEVPELFELRVVAADGSRRDKRWVLIISVIHGACGAAAVCSTSCTLQSGEPKGLLQLSRQQLRPAELGGAFVESPQGLFASLRSQSNVQAVREVGRAVPVKIKRNLKRPFGLEGQFSR